MNSDHLQLLMVAARYFPFMGGIQTHVHEVGRRFARNGIQVTLLTTVPPNLKNPLPKEEIVEGMRIIRVPAWPSQRDYYLAPEIYTLITRGKWDVMHCQGCHTFVPPLAMLAAREIKLPYVVTFHTGGHSSAFRNSIRNVQWRMQRPFFAHAAKLIGVSQFEANYFRSLLHLPAQQFSVIPNGVIFPESETTTPTERLLITSVGRLEKYKGHQHMIAALPYILEQRPDAHLLILGAGPYEKALRTLVDRLALTPYVEIRSVPASDRQGMAKLLAQSALVTLLSEYEAHPIAVIEALALQRPVLVADTSGLREIAEQGLARSISLKSTPEEIARAALQHIESSPTAPARFTLPTWDDCVQKLQDVYVSVARRELCVF
ncbi:MAG TPA: glycosyltransferase family 4 protein [Ktedonobacteraceae bacterium]|jgi:glycosyltransferase involved in cell wall biosynthesis|nr:glycosyltransferase family 4 protein [Ktedonobacteraceae bacterium]